MQMCSPEEEGGEAQYPSNFREAHGQHSAELCCSRGGCDVGRGTCFLAWSISCLRPALWKRLGRRGSPRQLPSLPDASQHPSG